MGPGRRPVALLVEALARDRHPWHRRPERRRVGLDGHEVTVLDADLQPQAPTEAPGEQRRPGRGRTESEDDTGVVVGRPRLGEQVVTVVPPGDEAEVVHRREGCGAGADDDADVTAQHLEPGGVAGLRTLVGREPHVPALAEQLR